MKLIIYLNDFFILIIINKILGIGDWGLGIGDWAQSPIPNEEISYIIILIKFIILFIINI